MDGGCGGGCVGGAGFIRRGVAVYQAWMGWGGMCDFDEVELERGQEIVRAVWRWSRLWRVQCLIC